MRKRDVSFGPRTREGATAWDTFMTLAATATKLGVSFYHYIHDRVSGAYQVPALADLIGTSAGSPPWCFLEHILTTPQIIEEMPRKPRYG